MRRFHCLLLLLALLAATSGCRAASRYDTVPASAAPVRVLFVGNSYTFVNDLPSVFKALGRSGGHTVVTGMDAQGGELLEGHVAGTRTRELLHDAAWDFVVLQEQSQVPAIEPARSEKMYPAARELAGSVRRAGATPIFFMTWAHRRGWPEAAMSYPEMQTRIDHAYFTIAQELHAPLAPVGFAWRETHNQMPDLELWQADGSHPTVAGTYLAACVFYTVIWRKSPEGLAYHAGLPARTAQKLQSIAARSVLGYPDSWQLQ